MRKQRAFTLIELLVVISIIALLMAILMPSLQRVRKQAKAVACQANLHQWGPAFSMYTGDNDGRFMTGWLSSDRGEGCWINILRPYYKEGNLRLCPTATKPVLEQGWWDLSSAWGDLGAAGEGSPWGPQGGFREGDYGSYGINSWVNNVPPDWKEFYGRPTKYSWKTTLVKGAGDIPVLTDCWWFVGHPYQTDEPPEYDCQVVATRSDNMRRYSINRHDGYVNGLFMDWSVRKIGLKGLWRLKWNRGYRVNDPLPVWPWWMRNFRDP